MKQLTRNEIVEIVRAPIYMAKDGHNSTETTAELVIAALEKAGVLMLVEDEPKEGDLVSVPWFLRGTEQQIGESYGILTEDNAVENDGEDVGCGYTGKESADKIIQRNSTPVYQCKKEVTNG